MGFFKTIGDLFRKIDERVRIKEKKSDNAFVLHLTYYNGESDIIGIRDRGGDIGRPLFGPQRPEHSVTFEYTIKYITVWDVRRTIDTKNVKRLVAYNGTSRLHTVGLNDPDIKNTSFPDTVEQIRGKSSLYVENIDELEGTEIFLS